MHALLAMIRRARTLWAAFVRRLVGVVAPPPISTTAALPSPAAAPESPPSAVAAEAPSPPVASLDAAPEHVRGDMPVSAVMAVPATEPGTARGDALRIDARPTLSVRQFFARVAAAVPGGLTVDFLDWQTVRVERYFLAMSASGRAPQRGPALAEDVAMKRAFDDFEWD